MTVHRSNPRRPFPQPGAPGAYSNPVYPASAGKDRNIANTGNRRDVVLCTPATTELKLD